MPTIFIYRSSDPMPGNTPDGYRFLVKLLLKEWAQRALNRVSK